MSCGLGAVILIYIIINHSTEAGSREINERLLAEITRTEEALEDETQRLSLLRNTREEKESEVVSAELRASRLIELISRRQAELTRLLQDNVTRDTTAQALKAELESLEAEVSNIKDRIATTETSGTVRNIVGAGDRQYLTGIKVGGQHILILLDASASMLDKTIVNVVRRRNLPDDIKIKSEKWQRAIRTVEWIIANMPGDAHFQLFTFAEAATPAVSGTEGKWLQVIEPRHTDEAMAGIQAVIPAGGTSLVNAFSVTGQLLPQPDNIFLVVDSLPTQGKSRGSRTIIDSRTRVGLFTESLVALPDDSPVNVILFPMEGDPLAAPSYWRLALTTGGSFLAPAQDWP